MRVKSLNSQRAWLVFLDVQQALLAIKALGKHPAGSQVIATRPNLTALLAIFNAFKDDADASNEALKCICNALLLIEPSRTLFVQKDVGGSDAVIDLLEVRALRRFHYERCSHQNVSRKQRPPNASSYVPVSYSLRPSPWLVPRITFAA